MYRWKGVNAIMLSIGNISIASAGFKVWYVAVPIMVILMWIIGSERYYVHHRMVRPHLRKMWIKFTAMIFSGITLALLYVEDIALVEKITESFAGVFPWLGTIRMSERLFVMAIILFILFLVAYSLIGLIATRIRQGRLERECEKIKRMQ